MSWLASAQQASPAEVMCTSLTRLSVESAHASTKPFCSSLDIIPAAVDWATPKCFSISFIGSCLPVAACKNIKTATCIIVKSFALNTLLESFSSRSWICLIRNPFELYTDIDRILLYAEPFLCKKNSALSAQCQ